jgi:hypothetical protein
LQSANVTKQQLNLLRPQNAGLKMSSDGGHRLNPIRHKAVGIKSSLIQAELPYGSQVVTPRDRVSMWVTL